MKHKEPHGEQWEIEASVQAYLRSRLRRNYNICLSGSCVGVWRPSSKLFRSRTIAGAHLARDIPVAGMARSYSERSLD